MIEIYFNRYGNTIVGDYSEYKPLGDAMSRKSVFVPEGYAVKAEIEDLRRLVEHVSLFGHCIKTLKAFSNACSLAGVEFTREP